MIEDCRCECHGRGVYGACSIEGGCGSLGCVAGRVRTAVEERRCVRGPRCADRTPERNDAGQPTGTWLSAAIPVDRGLCPACVRDVGYALRHLTGDVVELTMLIGRLGTLCEVVVASSPDPAVPIQLPIEALRAEIDTELQAWAEPVAERLGVDWDTAAMGRTRMGPRVQRAAHLLAQSVDTLLALPPQEHPAWCDGEPAWDPVLDCQDTIVRDGVDAGLSFLALHQLAYAALGRTALVYRLPAPCPWCDRRTLVRHNGADWVECEHCHKKIDEVHYHWLTAVLVREQQRIAATA